VNLLVPAGPVYLGFFGSGAPDANRLWY